MKSVLYWSFLGLFIILSLSGCSGPKRNSRSTSGTQSVQMPPPPPTTVPEAFPNLSLSGSGAENQTQSQSSPNSNGSGGLVSANNQTSSNYGSYSGSNYEMDWVHSNDPYQWSTWQNDGRNQSIPGYINTLIECRPALGRINDLVRFLGQVLQERQWPTSHNSLNFWDTSFNGWSMGSECMNQLGSVTAGLSGLEGLFRPGHLRNWMSDVIRWTYNSLPQSGWQDVWTNRPYFYGYGYQQYDPWAQYGSVWRSHGWGFNPYNPVYGY